MGKKMIKTLCKEAGRIELIDEIQYFGNYFIPQSPNTRIDPEKDIIQWKCQECNGSAKMTFQTRLNTEEVLCKRCKERKNKIIKSKREGTEKEFQDLCKLLRTSLPEQLIYAFLRKIFKDTERSKKYEWLDRSEIDIFIPELNLGIEYDGKYWHQEESFIGISKDELLKENGIDIFRIREKGLEMKDTSFCYEYNHNKNYANIHEPINAIIDFINQKYKKNIIKIKKENSNDVYDELKELALQNMRKEKEKISILGSWTEIEEYWDYEANNGLKPSDVLPSSRFNVIAKCPYCKMKCKFTPRLVYNWYGSHSFNPHHCEERFKYCLKLLKEKFKDGNLDLSNDNVDDRRLKDWLIVGATGIYGSNKERIKVECDKIGLKFTMNDLIETYKIAQPKDFKIYLNT